MLQFILNLCTISWILNLYLVHKCGWINPLPVLCLTDEWFQLLLLFICRPYKLLFIILYYQYILMSLLYPFCIMIARSFITSV
jgi:hypothetical protein